jgi:GNAT superfamily N-acetyltransferase
MTIRSVEPRDAAEVARLATQLGYPSTPDQVAQRLEVLAAKSESAVFVAEGEGRLDGWISIQGRQQVESDPDAIIDGLVVDEAARRKGVGRALIAAAEAWARERRFGSVRIRSNTVRVDARRFYESVGYEVFKTQNAFRKALT